ncbi:hypothetical protein BDV25DRAFT_171301 [Aspergillus avenaceus]|uniref:DUF7703 domain-containing protein n=1 Tax=Aspergillus avenaceus TaxID=36643 RepID=A0A5N6TZ61_ASPAV|nr:hypothetical protein BDV25DRAFT_171301 [Aspergillus avenaceus]
MPSVENLSRCFLETDNAGGESLSKTVSMALISVTMYNALELVVICLLTFKQRKGCYFWSLLTGSLSILLAGITYCIRRNWLGANKYVVRICVMVAWCGVYTSNLLVLWSRLHLVMQKRRTLQYILWSIIIGSAGCFIPETALFLGVLTPGSHRQRFRVGLIVMNMLIFVIFTSIEVVIAGLYMKETIQLLRLRSHHHNRRLLLQVLGLNILLVAIAITMIVLEFGTCSPNQMVVGPLAYGIKLKLEYVILGRLVKIARPYQFDSGSFLSSSGGATELRSTEHTLRNESLTHVPETYHSYLQVLSRQNSCKRN